MHVLQWCTCLGEGLDPPEAKIINLGIFLGQPYDWWLMALLCPCTQQLYNTEYFSHWYRVSILGIFTMTKCVCLWGRTLDNSGGVYDATWVSLFIRGFFASSVLAAQTPPPVFIRYWISWLEKLLKHVAPTCAISHKIFKMCWLLGPCCRPHWETNNALQIPLFLGSLMIQSPNISSRY